MLEIGSYFRFIVKSSIIIMLRKKDGIEILRSMVKVIVLFVKLYWWDVDMILVIMFSSE